MKERLKRVFGVFGGFFINTGKAIGRFLSHPTTVGVAMGLLLIALIGGLVYLALDDSYHRGRVYELAADNMMKTKTIDRAAVENAQLQYERDTYKEAATQLEAYLQQLQQTTMPIGQVFWCTNMSTDLIAQDKKSLVLATAEFVAKLTDVDVAPAGVCVDIVGITGSEVRGEMYVPAQRVFSGGAADLFLVYWQVLPGEEGKAQIIGYYSWITREWHPVGP